MRIQTFQELQAEYGKCSRGLDQDDLDQRDVFLATFPFSIIVEGGYLEIENLEKWIGQNLPVSFESLYFGKTGYDFGFIEYFFPEEESSRKLEQIVPLIFTTYPLAPNPNTVCRSIGYDSEEKYDPSIPGAMVYPAS